jgi:intergrase/recombinase
MLENFIENYGAELLCTAITAIAGYIGIVVKKLITTYINDKTKEKVAKTVVQAVEQIYKDIHGKEKFDKGIEYLSQMLTDRGITCTELELQLLLEGAVAEFNKAFEKKEGK